MKNSPHSLADIYEHACKQGIDIHNVAMKSRVAIMRPDGLCAIDYSKIENEADEKVILMEEISHFETFAFYPPDAPHSVWQKQEKRAMRHVFEKYYPPACLAVLMAKGSTEPWQLADDLNLPERFVYEMLLYYTQVQGICFDTLPTPTPEAPLNRPEPASPTEVASPTEAASPTEIKSPTKAASVPCTAGHAAAQVIPAAFDATQAFDSLPITTAAAMLPKSPQETGRQAKAVQAPDAEPPLQYWDDNRLLPISIAANGRQGVHVSALNAYEDIISNPYLRYLLGY